MNLVTVASWIGAFGTIGGAIIAVIVFMKKLADGQRCLLRSDMLRIYYANRKDKRIHQFEYENFSHLYAAYKAMKGNSFIDRVWKEIQKWEIETLEDVA